MYENLLKVQKEIGAIKKDSENPYFKSNYFDINALLDVVKPILNKNGFVLLQPLVELNGKLALKTMLISKDYVPETGMGMIVTTCPIPECADPQKYGSAITYFRRYALQSLLALQAEDDDANVASDKKVAPKGIIAPKKAKLDEDLPF